jgi:ATP-binding cassette, subfamily B, vacuolar membrane transporter HMT1/ACLQ
MLDLRYSKGNWCASRLQLCAVPDLVGESQASLIGVLLYFAAGLLPDPDGPFEPSRSNFHSWLVAVVYEMSILVLTQFVVFSLNGHGRLEISESGLGALRIILLLMMSAMFVASDRRQVWTKWNTGFEREGLISGADTAAAYGSVPSSKAAKVDAQATGWLDYFVGFRALFPYIWYDSSAADCHMV